MDVVNKNFDLAFVSGRSELLFSFIAEVKKEFADQNWDYLDFIADKVLNVSVIITVVALSFSLCKVAYNNFGFGEGGSQKYLKTIQDGNK